MSLYSEIFEKGYIKNPIGIALQCDQTKFTYCEVDYKVKKLAEKFKEKGICANSKVALRIIHPMEFTFVMLTLNYLGAIPMPIYRLMGDEKLKKLCDTYDINFVILSGEQNLFKNNNEKDQDVIFFGEIYLLNNAIDEFLQGVKLIMFTSGTTNVPKAIMLTKNNVCSNVSSISEYLKITQRDSILLVKDMSHSSSIIGELFVGLINGCKIVFTTKLLRAVTILSIIHKEKINVFFAVPALLKGFISTSITTNYDMSSLKIINFYGAYMNEKDVLKLIHKFPETNIIYSYGQTEASPRVTYIEKTELVKRPASCGKPIRDVKVKIVNQNEEKCEPYTIGEVVVQGPNVMRGYYRDESKTVATIIDKNLYTGDLGYIDKQGFLYITGRKDNMFTYAGKNIYPEEIEGVISNHTDVLEALVDNINKEDNIVEIIAYIVLKKEHKFDESSILNYCRAKLEDYKVPKKIILVTALEKTPSGKIIRSQFRY